ncbi:gamma-glutamyltransferase family protein, partial [Sediminicurvatus halobius]
AAAPARRRRPPRARGRRAHRRDQPAALDHPPACARGGRRTLTVFFPDGFAPVAGARWASEGHATTLKRIAESNATAFYEGDLAEATDEFARATGGFLRGEDLAAHRSEWVEPIACDYHGYRVWEIPPNTQAIAALQALGILEGVDLPRHREDEHGLHLQIEAMKLGFADALAHIGEPGTMQVSSDSMLADAYIARRRGAIGEEASDPVAGMPGTGDTVYLAAADGEGMMVSFIQSNYQGFGSGLLVPGTGIALHNRGCGFSLERGHPNELAPGKRPYHTIMPGFLGRADGEPVGPFGVMGAFMQPQGHMQMVLNTVDYRLHPQAALDAPRWRWTGGRSVQVEQSMPAHVVKSLLARGHDISVAADDTGFGRGQIIWRNHDGVLVGGSETRADGQVAAF